MTLVLALRCGAGIVLASDGQATAEAAGQPTRRPVRKLFDLGGRIAWGAAGSIGLQQTLGEALAEREHELVRGADAGGLRRELTELVIPIQQRALKDFVAHPGSQPPDLACIFCWREGDAARILSIPRTGSDHQLHESHSAVGTGDIFADFAMASIAPLDTGRLTLEQAKMVAFKAVSDAIDVAAVYLGPPIQMYVITGEGARAVPASELDGGLADSVEAWKCRQRETLGPLAPGGSAVLVTPGSGSDVWDGSATAPRPLLA